ncbi:MAG TPA: sulfate adenylyltransferase [Thermoplasmata archaeon]|nr:sulfate adenylyltransferase [Thermoplasmata archaeon]
MALPPHGGRLIDRSVSASERSRRDGELADLLQIRPVIDEVYDAEKIGIGAYSPLEGFMDSTSLESVISTSHLPGGNVWSMPILLAPVGKENEAVVQKVRSGDDVALLDDKGRFFALLHVNDKFSFDKKRVAQSTFGTTDTNHPNVADLEATGPIALGGRIDLIRRLELPTGPEEMTPLETRALFQRKGWKRVAAYQCRNPPHTAHEYLQRLTLEREDVDGLFIHPVVGRLKKGDYRPDVILEAYRQLIRHYYSEDRVQMAAFSITMRYAGPKAALFLAIVRKNFGCDSYIVGRDQAGVGKYYDPYACHRIFDEFPVDIQPLRYEETFFCRTCGWMATSKTCHHPAADRLDTSQTRIRKALTEGVPPPKEILRPEVFQILVRPNVVLTE